MDTDEGLHEILHVTVQTEKLRRDHGDLKVATRDNR